MKHVLGSIFITLGLALCVGCGDNSTQSWEDIKPNSAGKSDAKSGEVANNDTADNDTANNDSTIEDVGGSKNHIPHGTANPHDIANPHAGMQMNGTSESTTIENDGKLDVDAAHWTVPKKWVRKSPGMMLLAEYAVPKAEGDKQDGRLTVSQLGGGVEGNVDRWKKQFSKLDKQNQETFDLDQLKVTLVDFSGIYNDSRGMMGPSVARSGYRMLGAVVEVPGQSALYFLKCYGPEKTIAAHADEIKAFIRSMKVDK
jgi:hypothetical protein